MKRSIPNLVRLLELKPHPEGGFYKETYRSELIISEKNLPERFEGDRSCLTSIYYLLLSDSFSAFHRIKQDEIWHFYLGSTLSLHLISEAGEYRCILIGNKLEQNNVLQYTVPAGYWFAAEVEEEDSFALVGCNVAPGFDFRDFELGKREDLLKMFPKHRSLIRRLTRI